MKKPRIKIELSAEEAYGLLQIKEPIAVFNQIEDACEQGLPSTEFRFLSYTLIKRLHKIGYRVSLTPSNKYSVRWHIDEIIIGDVGPTVREILRGEG